MPRTRPIAHYLPALTSAFGEKANSGVGLTGSGVASRGIEASESSIPSTRLEQEAQMFGLRERLLPEALIGSPQQMQILGFTGRNDHKQKKWKRPPPRPV